MNKVPTGLAAAIFILVSLACYQPPGDSSGGVSANQALPSEGQILSATVLIEMRFPVSEGAGAEAEGMGRGIGTLVAIGGENYLVTHNHWGAVLQDWTVIEIYDSQDRPLKPLLGDEFNRLIRYQDEGTLILQVPPGLKTGPVPTVSGDPGIVQPGEIVQLSYRQVPGRETAGVLAARVEEVINRHGVPAYRLRSLSGQPIQRGDSGGGVWHNGKYVGNLWVSIRSVAPAGGQAGSESQPTDTSYAALYPTGWSPQQASENAPDHPSQQPAEQRNTIHPGIE